MLHFDFRCTVPRVYYHLESTNQRICHFLALHTRDANAIIDLSRKTTIARFFYISPLTFRRRLIRYEVANERYDRSSANRFHFLRVATTSRERGSVRTGVRFGCTTSNVGQSVTKSPAKSRRGTRLRFRERFNLTHTRARARHYAFGAASRKLSACYDSRARARARDRRSDIACVMRRRRVADLRPRQRSNIGRALAGFLSESRPRLLSPLPPQ